MVKFIHVFFFFQLLRAGWWGEFSLRCQPVDTSDTPQTRLVNNVTEFCRVFLSGSRSLLGYVVTPHVYLAINCECA